MDRSTVRQSSDWLRPTRPLIRQAEAGPDLMPHITQMSARDDFWATISGMVLGSILGVSIVLAIAS